MRVLLSRDFAAPAAGNFEAEAVTFAGAAGLPKSCGEQIDDMHADAVLDVDLAQVVQAIGPDFQLAERVRHDLGNQDVPGVAAVHHALGDIDPGAGDVLIGVDIGHPIHGSGVDPEPQLDVRMLP